ncbi:MAG: hypothetical protein COV70_00780 [Parcubacteria group bacterium CG11_big_fil_rev_8_21_14_0_20_39_22]|nr:MAG: hypothetical protein COV70_00780 [Parcubacteria group bacterium CG11_big_fil_rev_8_21_14_0_20_39_22]
MEGDKKENKFKNIAGIVVAAVIIFGAGFYVWSDLRGDLSESEVVDSGENDRQVDLGDGIGFEYSGDGDITVERVDDIGVEKPDLNRKITYLDYFSEDVIATLDAQIKETKNNLAENPTSFEDWVNMGLHYKFVNDYEGSRQVWEYLGALYPDTFLPFGNLGNLYGYYLNQPEKAIENYERAIENSKSMSQWYFELASFYSQSLKNDAKALDVAKLGLSRNPENEKLKELVEHYEGKGM